MRRSISPKCSGSLRRSLSDAAGLLTIWSWIAVRSSVSAVSGVADRLHALVLSRLVGSEPIDARAMDWALRNLSEEP